MTYDEIRKRLDAVYTALDSVQVSGHKNCNLLGSSMTILYEIIHSPAPSETETAET